MEVKSLFSFHNEEVHTTLSADMEAHRAVSLIFFANIEAHGFCKLYWKSPGKPPVKKHHKRTETNVEAALNSQPSTWK